MRKRYLFLITFLIELQNKFRETESERQQKRQQELHRMQTEYDNIVRQKDADKVELQQQINEAKTLRRKFRASPGIVHSITSPY